MYARRTTRKVPRSPRALLAWTTLLLCLLGTPVLGQWHAIAHGLPEHHHALVYDDGDDQPDQDNHDTFPIHRGEHHNCAAYDDLTLATVLHLLLPQTQLQMQCRRTSPLLPARFRTLPAPQHYAARAPPTFS